MNITRNIRLGIKKNYPELYTQIRSSLFSVYSTLHAKKRSSFTQESIVTVTHEGVAFSIVVDPANGFVDTEIYTHGIYEPDILTVIKQHLQPGDTFVDIGTNIGQHSLFAGKIVGESGSVISFEPIPHIVKQFQKSIDLNKPNSQHAVHNVACGDEAATLQLLIKSGNTGGSGFHHDVTNEETIPVQVVLADEYLANYPSVDFIKIDTEGHELEALRGLIQTLEKHKPVVLVEFSPAFWKEAAKEKTEEFFTLFLERDYKLYDLEDGHKEIVDYTSWYNTFTKVQTNLLCLPKNS